MTDRQAETLATATSAACVGLLWWLWHRTGLEQRKSASRPAALRIPHPGDLGELGPEEVDR